MPGTCMDMRAIITLPGWASNFPALDGSQFPSAIDRSERSGQDTTKMSEASNAPDVVQPSSETCTRQADGSGRYPVAKSS